MPDMCIIQTEESTPEQLEALKEYQRVMETEVIPEIVRVVRMRQQMAQISRDWIIG